MVLVLVLVLVLVCRGHEGSRSFGSMVVDGLRMRFGEMFDIWGGGFCLSTIGGEDYRGSVRRLWEGKR